MYALQGLQLAVRRLTINLGNIEETKPPGGRGCLLYVCHFVFVIPLHATLLDHGSGSTAAKATAAGFS